jgi:acyl-CoA thioesterase FadM
LSRSYSSYPPRAAATPTEEAKNAISPRWLSDTKSRIGRCITFGLTPKLVDEAGRLLSILGRDWRELVAGSEGFLTSEKRAGLHRQNIVWGEQDSMGHVNNVMYVRFAESGRCNWIRNYSRHVDPAHKRQWEELLTSRGIGLILKSITVDFKFPMTWPDRISVYHKLRSRPDEATESLILDVLIMSEVKQRPAARCLEDVVVYDYRAGKKSTLEPFMLEQLKHTFDLQEAVKAENRGEIQQIERRVQILEKESWDRPDAKEDFGNAQHP